jgi:hypothetical protein
MYYIDLTYFQKKYGKLALYTTDKTAFPILHLHYDSILNRKIPYWMSQTRNRAINYNKHPMQIF